jgi:hypothetical protein
MDNLIVILEVNSIIKINAVYSQKSEGGFGNGNFNEF